MSGDTDGSPSTRLTRWRKWALWSMLGLGLLVHTACADLFDALNRWSQKKSMARLRTVAHAVETFREAHGSYPIRRHTEIGEIRTLLAPWSMEAIPTDDGWGPILFRSSGDHYAMWSQGRNGRPDVHPYGGDHEGFDVDLVMLDGDFWQWPAGGRGGRPVPQTIADPFAFVESTRNPDDRPR